MTAEDSPSETPKKAEMPKAKPQKPAERQESESPPEVGGPKGPEPTRYGDWEKNGIISDF